MITDPILLRADPCQRAAARAWRHAPILGRTARLGALLVLTWARMLTAAETLSVTPQEILPQLEFDLPLYVGNAGDGSHRLFVLEQDGRMYTLKMPEGRRVLALDLRGAVHHPREGYTEEGLLALAFHPHFRTHPELFLWYCIDHPLRTVLAKYRMDPDKPDEVDFSSETRLLVVEQPFANHKGGTLAFGPDGFLYLSLGDGGSGGDPHGNAQNLGVLLGKILRLDVDHQSSALPYAIPTDNPFVSQSGARGEIWAYGLRNVWRMSFDRLTGDLWAGDVGQDLWEEIDLITKGGNYGWNLREGTHPYQDHEPVPGLIDPLLDYGHNLGRSVIGGYVYRGRKFPALRGCYLYGDYLSGRIWALKMGPQGLLFNRQVADSHLTITSFGEDEDGEIYLTSFDGHLYQITLP